jgi:hypothetical protein
MANLFIAYDLDTPGQNYQKVEAAIAALGQVVKVQFSLYYVKTNLSVKDAESRVWAAMDANDRLIAIDASNAQWHNIFPGASDFIQAHWHR